MTEQKALDVLKRCSLVAYQNADGTDEDSAELYEALQTVFALIKRKQAEIEKWKAEYKRACAERDAHIFTNNFIKSEAIKEFAEKLKEKSFKTIGNYGLTKDVVEVCDINLAKEMVGEL